MNTSIIKYTVQAEFSETNKKNISRVMDELKGSGFSGVRYSAFVLEDDRTFVHFAVFKDEEAKTALGNLEAFKLFQSELKASNPEVPPKAEALTLVGSSYDFWKD